MGKSIAELKILTIEHYERMIKWAEKQDCRKSVYSAKMEIELGENYFSRDCPFCDAFHDEYRGCGCCPLKKNENVTCCDDRWRELYNSKKWGEWIRNAKRIIEFVENVEE